MSTMQDTYERDIYGPFEDGCGNRRMADPIRVYRRLQQATAGQLAQLLTLAKSDDPVGSSEAEEKLVAAVVFAFDLAPFDPATGGGTTESMCRALLSDFVGWMDAKKKSRQTSQTSSPSTETPSFAADDSTTPPASGSGSIKRGCGCGKAGT
jgi:hypothetical protein